MPDGPERMSLCPPSSSAREQMDCYQALGPPEASKPPVLGDLDVEVPLVAAYEQRDGLGART